MKANDSILDRITSHTVSLDRVAAHLRLKVIEQLRKLEQELIDKVTKLDRGEVYSTVYQRARTDALLKQTQDTIRKHFSDIAKEHAADLQQLAQTEQTAISRFTNDAIGADITTVATSAQTLSRLVDGTLIEGAPSKEWWSRQAGALKQRFEDTVRAGMLRGDTTDDIVRAVRGTRKQGYKDGIMEVPRRDAAALVRTSVMSVANAARNDFYHEWSDLMSGLQWHSTLDGRTTTICKARSGLMYTVDGQPIGHSVKLVGPPAHWSCRSTLVPVLKSWDDLSGPGALPKRPGGDVDGLFTSQLRKRGFDDDAIQGIKRNAQSSMDGQVPAPLDYEQWLKRKPVSFQIDVLGPSRYQMWQDGTISIVDLVDNRGNPLTLAELAERIAGGRTHGASWNS